jgi:hypothetical protein
VEFFSAGASQGTTGDGRANICHELQFRDVSGCDTEAGESAVDRLLDADYHADCEADTSPEVPLAEVRAGLASIPGETTADFATERDER